MTLRTEERDAIVAYRLESAYKTLKSTAEL